MLYSVKGYCVNRVAASLLSEIDSKSEDVATPQDLSWDVDNNTLRRHIKNEYG